MLQICHQISHVVRQPRVFCLLQLHIFSNSNKFVFLTKRRLHNFVEPLRTDGLGVEVDEEDTFGLIAEKQGVKVFHGIPASLEDEEKEVNYLSLFEKKSAHAFHERCKKLAKQNRVEECVNLLETEMLKVQKVKPLEYNFSVVMGALARSGYAEKTISLFYTLKSYNIIPTAPTYTTLFNAVANSKKHSDMDVLRREYLKARESKVHLNRRSYNALLKAYVKHESLEECMGIFRESIRAGIEPDARTFTFLLMCCEKNKSTGFRVAIQIWRKMAGLGIQPDAACLMQFLKTLVYCDIGDIAMANKILLQPQTDNLKKFLKQHVRRFRWLKKQESLPNPEKLEEELKKEPLALLGVTVENLVSDGTNSSETLPESNEGGIAFPNDKNLGQDVIQNSELQVTNSLKNQVNLLSNCDNLKLVSIQKCPKPSDKLQLIGGLKGVLDLMEQYNIDMSARLLTIIAQSLEQSCVVEDELMEIALKSKVQIDVDFYNSIMHRRAKRNQHTQAKAVLKTIESLQLVPNYRTWCIRAMSCVSFRDGKELIDAAKTSGVNIGVVFLTSLISSMLRNPRNKRVVGYPNTWYPDYKYLTFLLNEVQVNNVAANETLVTLLETATAWPKNYKRWELADPNFEKQIAKFRKVYRQWLETTNFDSASNS